MPKPKKPKRPISLTDVVFGSTVFPLIFIGLFYALDTYWLKSPLLLSNPINLSGLMFIILGVSLTSWCFRIALALPKEPILVTWGPWSKVRHPIYLAAILFNLGAALMIGTALLLLEFLGYVLIDPLFSAVREERNLRKSFPDEYEEYSKQIPSWISRISE